MNAQHIPAPWQIDVRPDSSMEIQTQSGIPIAVLCLLRERDSNARLIAAAPDLLAVCLAAEEHWRRVRPWDEELLPQLRAAIAKATGQ